MCWECDHVVLLCPKYPDDFVDTPIHSSYHDRELPILFVQAEVLRHSEFYSQVSCRYHFNLFDYKNHHAHDIFKHVHDFRHLRISFDLLIIKWSQTSFAYSFFAIPA